MVQIKQALFWFICVFPRMPEAMERLETTPPASDEDDKAKSRSVALQPQLWIKVDAKVDARFGGNRSAYFRQLVEADMADSLPGDGKTVLVDLARRYHPALAPELERLCVAPDGPLVNQARVLARLLETVATTLRVIDQRDRDQVHEETALQAELRRHKLIDGALEAVTDHLVAGGLLLRASEILKQPSALARRREGGGRGESK